MVNKKIRSKKINKMKYEENETLAEVKKYVIVLLGIIIVFIGLYFLTGKLVVKDLVENKDESNVEISYSEILMGTIFIKPEEKYYVVIYNNETDTNGLSQLIETYRKKSNSEKVYFVDLSNKFNSGFYEKDYNNKILPETLSDLKVGDYTLFTIEKGSIKNMISGYESVSSFFN